MVHVDCRAHASLPIARSLARTTDSGCLAAISSALWSRRAISDNPLPLWDEGAWGDDPKWEDLWTPIAGELRSSDGFVIVSPEWSAMVPAGLKNFFLLCGGDLLAHKPGLIVTISAAVVVPPGFLRQLCTGCPARTLRRCRGARHGVDRRFGRAATRHCRSATGSGSGRSGKFPACALAIDAPLRQIGAIPGDS